MGLTFRFAALALVLFSASLPARADWTGAIDIKTDPPAMAGQGEQKGTISGKGPKMRVELDIQQMGGKTVVLVDHRTHKSTMVMDAQKAFFSIDTDKMHGRSTFADVRCESDVAAECLAKSGFKKTGSGTVNGKKCDIWENDRTGVAGEKTHDKIWVPQGIKGFAMVRQESKSPSRTVTVDVLNFKEQSLPDAQFEVPAGYTDITSKMGPGMGAPGPHGPPGAPGHP